MSLYLKGGKRSLDLVISGVASLVLLPVHIACAAAVAFTSGRPIYFRQARAGRDGQEFDLVKFRTMTVGTHEISGGYPTSAMVTPVGRWLRKLSLDEIPQLLNIFKGDMSLVGPRPALTDQVQRYTARQRQRLVVRPGLTGLAQVRYRNNAPWSLRIESDLEYIEELSAWTDFKILLRTIPAVLFGAGVVTGQTVDQVDDLGR